MLEPKSGARLRQRASGRERNLNQNTVLATIDLDYNSGTLRYKRDIVLAITDGDQGIRFSAPDFSKRGVTCFYESIQDMHIEFRHVQLSLPEVASLNTTEKVFVHNEVKSYLTRRPKIDWIYHHLWKENHKKTVVLWIDHMPLDRITREERHK